MIPRLINLPRDHSFFLFGPRQTGKSTLVQSVLPKDVWQVNLLLSDVYFKYLRDPSLFRREALEQIEERHVSTIFVDEIQRIPILLNEIHWLIEKTKCRFILTGSSARKLKRGAANLLAGRAFQRFLGPFIYKEILTTFRLQDVLRFGTLPAIHRKEEAFKIETLQAYADIYLKEEIQAEGIVRNLPGFTRFLQMAASTFTELVSYSNIGRECGLPPRSVQSYYDILEDTLLGFRLPGWNKSTRRQLGSHPKFYFFDNGVVNSLNRLLRDEISPLVRGRLFEQWMMNEVRTLLQYLKKDHELFYWRTQRGAEVDLIIARQKKLVAAIEFKTSAVIQNAHLGGLHHFLKEHPQVPAYVVCEAANPYQLKGITVLPWKLFLEETLHKILK